MEDQFLRGIRHIKFDFELLDTDHLPRFPTHEESETLKDLFPTQFGVSVVGPFLQFLVRELPPHPWPATVAGLPAYLSTEPTTLPWQIGRPGPPRKKDLCQYDAKRTITKEMYLAIIEYFETRAISIGEVMWFFGCLRIRVPEATDINCLPGTLCQVATFYLTDTIQSPTDAAFRIKDPKHLLPEDSTYVPLLRPGAMVSSTDLCTTAGVLVKNSQNESFMTVASHGFPLEDTDVHHPDPDSPLIGEVVRRIGSTDIALVKLHDNIRFENRTFQNLLEPDGVILSGISDPFTIKPFSVMTMDNPFTGLIDGQFLTKYMTKLYSADSDEHLWIVHTWSWYGQDAIPVAGSCGSAIWDTNGKVLSFFRLLNGEGIGIGVAAFELVAKGFTLV